MKRHIVIVGLLAWLLVACSPTGPTVPAPSPTGPSAPTLQPTLLTPTVKPIQSPTPSLPIVSTLVPSPPLPPLPTIVPQPTPAPTPFPDEQAIVETILGTGTGEHWAANIVSGSFTAPGADERLALAGNVGERDEMRWVVVGRTDGGWRLRGVSEVLGMGFDAPPYYYVPPDLLDFDGDGQQEVLSHYFRMLWGWTTAVDTLYRWDGQSLARVWGVPNIMDNRMADNQDVPQPYRENYQAAWEWADLDGNAPDEILLHEEAAFYLPGEEGYVKDDAPSISEESGERAFRWDGEAFRPYAPGGPAGTFAYIAGDTLWLWQNHAACPLGMKGVREFLWSPDGRRIAWWAETSIESTFRVILGVYDLPTGARWEFPLDGAPSTLRWAPDGRLVYAVPPNYPHALLDPETGQQEPLPIGFSDTWSPEGDLMAYERSGGVYVYAPTTGRERLLVRSPEGAGRITPRPFDPVWSPRGDWIACSLETITNTWVGLVYPGAPEPVGASDLLDTFSGWEAPALQFAWSPDGAHLAVLTSDPRFAQQPTTLYLAEVSSSGDEPVGRPRWREVLRLETVTSTVGLAWSPGGERVAVAVGNEVWEATTAGEMTFRYHFAAPELEWTVLEWAPDGGGFLVGLTGAGVGYENHLYWFPADGDEPELLLAGPVAAHWAPRTVEAQAMALVEHTDAGPLLHFVGGDGSDIVVPAEEAARYTSFQVGGERIYYGARYADRNGVVSLPDISEGCHPPLVSPDGSRMAWLCGESPDMNALIDGTAELHYRVLITDGDGNDPREVWEHVETGPGYRSLHLVSWRADGTVIYLAQPEYGMVWALFDYNPGMLALDVNTGQVAQVGDLESLHDALVSPDGVWLAQAKIATWSGESVTITLRSLIDGTERVVPGAEGAWLAGDFSFSPDGAWLAWQEWVPMPGSQVFLIRALRLPAGEPVTVYEEALTEGAGISAPSIVGGWLGKDDLVLVQEGGKGPSTLVTLPSAGPGFLFSPFAFLGVCGESVVTP